jgi:hypothetical protein
VKIPIKQRPTCSCGEKMKFVEFQGYYNSFWYWDCDKCDIQDNMEQYEPDIIISENY